MAALYWLEKSLKDSTVYQLLKEHDWMWLNQKCGVDKRMLQEMIFRQNRIGLTTTSQRCREVQQMNRYKYLRS